MASFDLQTFPMAMYPKKLINKNVASEFLPELEDWKKIMITEYEDNIYFMFIKSLSLILT